jgi:hypothetical protein
MLDASAALVTRGICTYDLAIPFGAVMSKKLAWVNGWEVRPHSEGSFAVYDDHSMMAGPFGRVTEAIEAAMKLPHPTGTFGGQRLAKGDTSPEAT